VLNQADPFGDLHLLLLCQLAGWAGDVGGRIEDLREGVVGLLDIWRRLLQLFYTVTVVSVAVCQQGNVIRCGRLQTIPHLSHPSEHGRTATRGRAGDREILWRGDCDKSGSPSRLEGRNKHL